MTKRIDKTYKTEKLLEWERKSLIGKFSIFSFSKKLTWLTLGKIILGLCFIGFIVPFIPPRYSIRRMNKTDCYPANKIIFSKAWVSFFAVSYEAQESSILRIKNYGKIPDNRNWQNLVKSLTIEHK